jgi:hypothetical protein
LVPTGFQVTIRNTQKNSAQFSNVPNARQAAEFDRDQAAPCWPGVGLPFLVLVATFSIVPLGTALLYGSAQLVIYEVPVFWMAWAAGSLWLMFDGGRFLNGLSAETARVWAPGLILLGLLNLGISISILLFSAAGGRG